MKNIELLQQQNVCDIIKSELPALEVISSRSGHLNGNSSSWILSALTAARLPARFPVVGGQLATSMITTLRSSNNQGSAGIFNSHLWSSPLAHLQWNFIQQFSNAAEVTLPPALNGFCKF